MRHFPKEITLSKNSTKPTAWRLVPALLCLQGINHNLYWKIKFLNKSTYIRSVISNLSILAQISMIPFYRGFFENYKGPGTIFLATIFTVFFDKNVHFVMLLKLAKFHYQTVFTSQVIQWDVFRVSCLGIWWRHDI